MQVADATDTIDKDSLYKCFDDVIVPVCRQFQVDPVLSNLGTYILEFAKIATLSEVNMHVNWYTFT